MDDKYWEGKERKKDKKTFCMHILMVNKLLKG